MESSIVHLCQASARHGGFRYETHELYIHSQPCSDSEQRLGSHNFTWPLQDTHLAWGWLDIVASWWTGGRCYKIFPAAKLVGTDITAIIFKVIGKGRAIQENLLPGTGKEMATMYHCNDFKDCSKVQATHYCAKQNQPELILDTAKTTSNMIVMACDMNTSPCNSVESYVHMIKHELSQDSNNLRTTYTIYKDDKYEKDSIYHFKRK